MNEHTEWTAVNRLTLVSEVARGDSGAPWVTEGPVWLQPGDRYGLDEDRGVLVVVDSDGGVRRYPCWFATGPDAIR